MKTLISFDFLKFSNVFNIANLVESSKPESISVYIFDSEQARIEGLKIFNQHIETAKLVSYPIAYEQNNALVIYFSSREKNTKFGEKDSNGNAKVINSIRRATNLRLVHRIFSK